VYIHIEPVRIEEIGTHTHAIALSLQHHPLFSSRRYQEEERKRKENQSSTRAAGWLTISNSRTRNFLKTRARARALRAAPERRFKPARCRVTTAEFAAAAAAAAGCKLIFERNCSHDVTIKFFPSLPSFFPAVAFLF
jgi:hypothetical protein